MVERGWVVDENGSAETLPPQDHGFNQLSVYEIPPMLPLIRLAETLLAATATLLLLSYYFSAAGWPSSSGDRRT